MSFEESQKRIEKLKKFRKEVCEKHCKNYNHEKDKNGKCLGCMEFLYNLGETVEDKYPHGFDGPFVKKIKNGKIDYGNINIKPGKEGCSSFKG